MNNQPPRFNGWQPASQDFDASRTGLITPFQYFDVDLSVAPTVQTAQYPIVGDFIFQDLDPAFAGNVTIEFNRQQDAPNAPIYMVPGLALTGTFKGFRLNWVVQPGAKARFIYSTGSRINPASASIATIGSITNAVKIVDSGGQNFKTFAPFEAPNSVQRSLATEDHGFYYSTSFGTFGAQTANAPVNVIAAGSNVNGYLLHRAVIRSNTASSIAQMGLIAKATAPATPQDGDQLVMNDFQNINGAAFQDYAKTERTIRVAPGKRLDYICDTLESASSHKSALYHLLT